MIEIYIDFEDGTCRTQRLRLPCVIGRDVTCQFRIAHWRVAREHLRVSRLGELLQLEDLGTLGGTRVNGSRVSQHFPLLPNDDVIFGPCRARIHSVPDMVDQEAYPKSVVDTHTHELERGPEHLSTHAQRALRATLHASLIRLMDVRKHDLAKLPDNVLRHRCESLVRDLIAQQAAELSPAKQQQLINDVVSDAVGYGPLQALLDDPSVSEIMVNRYDRIFVEIAGRLCPHIASFSSEMAVRSVIERIIGPIGRRIDDASPMVDARLPDGSRVNAVLAPISVSGTCLTIRKFPARPLSLHELKARGCVAPSVAEFLCLCVEQRISLLISGGTGSGKTTLLNTMAAQIPLHERIVTIEDAAELRIDHPHVVTLEARPSNAEGRGEVSIRALVKNALRMRPDRIIVGECRGAEALDMLSAMNTGHEGSLSTLHANSPRDALARLETMVLMASAQLPLQSIRELISRSVQLIAQLTRLPDGSRLLVALDEVTGMESGHIQMHSLVRYHRTSKQFVWQGVRPVFAEQWQASGVAVQTGWFGDQTVAG